MNLNLEANRFSDLLRNLKLINLMKIISYM